MKNTPLGREKKERECVMYMQRWVVMGRTCHHSLWQISTRLLLCTWRGRQGGNEDEKKIFLKAKKKKVRGIFQSKMQFDWFQGNEFLQSGYCKQVLHSETRGIHSEWANKAGVSVAPSFLNGPSFPAPAPSAPCLPLPRNSKSIWKLVTAEIWNSSNEISLLGSSR